MYQVEASEPSLRATYTYKQLQQPDQSEMSPKSQNRDQFYVVHFQSICSRFRCNRDSCGPGIGHFSGILFPEHSRFIIGNILRSNLGLQRYQKCPKLLPDSQPSNFPSDRTQNGHFRIPGCSQKHVSDWSGSSPILTDNETATQTDSTNIHF